MKKIGVKFCGQCNARVRLRLIFDSLNELDKDSEYLFYKKENDYDSVLILCGCPNACAEIDTDLPVKKVYPEIGESADNAASRIIKQD